MSIVTLNEEIQGLDLKQIKIVREMLQIRAEYLYRLRVNNLKPADVIEWEGKRGYRKGIFLSAGPKNVKVQAEDGVIWTLHPTFILKVNGEEV